MRVSASWLRPLADGILSIVLAPDCVSCRQPLPAPTRGPVCGTCWAAIVPFTPPLCVRCGDPLPTWRPISLGALRCARCRRRPSAIAHSRAIGPYTGSLRDIIHGLKYDGCRSLAAKLALRMRESGADLLDDADAVVPVPLHRRRRRARGFNQAEDLARGLGRPIVRALRRRRVTRSQTDLPAAQRHANVRDAFAIRRRSNVSGLRVVIVDDVCTTGATLEACARVLREAGAREVSALTAARVASTPSG
jgi:ComF family protein